MSAEVYAISICVFAAGLGLVQRGINTRLSRVFQRIGERLEKIDERLANVESLCVAQEKQRDFDNQLIRAAAGTDGK